MDGAKAKNVVIVLLLAFNIFLLFINLTFVRGEGIRKETIENTEAILSQRGVTLECSIPTTSNALNRLEYTIEKLDRNSIAMRLLGGQFEVSNQGDEFFHESKKLRFISDTQYEFTDSQPGSNVDLTSDERARRAAQSFLKDSGTLDGGKYIEDGLTRNQDGSVTVAFVESYEGYLIFDNYCIVTLDQKGVRQLLRGRLQVKGFTVKSGERFEAYQALLARFKMGSSVVITAIDSGYKLEEAMTDGVESVEMLPAWRVTVKGKSEPLYLYPHISEE
jgi:regulatory protein YycI of two-component signal transduction system YycFG